MNNIDEKHWKTHFHITVDPETPPELFNATGKRLGLKPTYIRMDRNMKPSTDVMFTVYQKGNSTEKMFQLRDEIEKAGIRVIRLKMEEQFKSIDETLNLEITPENYLEFHIKIPFHSVREFVNLGKVYEIRLLLSGNVAEAESEIMSFRAFSKKDMNNFVPFMKRANNLFHIQSVHSEQIVYDSNPSVDDGWAVE